MFNAPLRSDAGRISAFYILDLLQSDALYFRDDQIVLQGQKHRVLGMQFNSEKLDELGDVTQDLTAFARDVRDWMYFCQDQSGLFVAAQDLSEEARQLLGGQALTAVTLMNLLCTNKLKLSRHDNLCLVAADLQVKNAFTSLGKYIHSIIRCAADYDGISQQFDIIFATSQTKDAKSLSIRRALVCTAATMSAPFELRKLKAQLQDFRELTMEQLQQFADDFVLRGIFVKQDDKNYVLNFDSQQASILYAEHTAALEAEQNQEVIRTLVLKQATMRYMRVKKAIENCTAAIAQHDRAQKDTGQELTHMQQTLDHMQHTNKRKSSGFATFFTIVLFLLAAASASFGTYHLLYSLQPTRVFINILPSFSVSLKLGICICYAAAFFFLLWAVLRIISKKNTAKHCIKLQEHCASLQTTLQMHTQKAEQARQESGIYAAYLVLTRTIAKDMQDGDFRGLDLAQKLVPSQVCDLQNEDAFTIHAQIIIALCHCGTCTQTELAFLSGAGHERIRRALYDMIAAGQIVLWREDDVQKFCLSQGL